MQLPILIAQKLISCKWVKKTPTAPLIYICCCVQYFMAKQSFTHYYVQALVEGSAPQVVYHTHNEEKNEYYHKFMDRKKAQELAEAEKKITPEHKFRVVKCTETYDPKPWF